MNAIGLVTAIQKNVGSSPKQVTTLLNRKIKEKPPGGVRLEFVDI